MKILHKKIDTIQKSANVLEEENKNLFKRLSGVQKDVTEKI
jgi:hypothetical protein